MTNKQAIEKLNDIRCHVKETSIEEQALVMAIEALKKAGIYGDIIYREDALMCLTGEYPADFKHDELIAKFIRRIRKLPSAQPEERTETHAETHACDCISRKDAIRWIKTECNPYGKPTLDFESGKRVMKHLEQMPPAQPEYEPVTAEDFAKTMSETSVYSYMVWHSEALSLMERQGFVICKKTM